MKIKFKQAVVFAGVVAALFLSSAAYAQSVDNAAQGEMRPRREPKQRLIEELGLTVEQQEQIKEQCSENKEKNKELREKIRSKRLELKQELEKQNIDKSKIDSLVAEIKILMGQQLEQRVESILSMKEILTPEQFEKFQQKVRITIKNRRGRLKNKSKERKDGLKGGFLE
ncbi:MAG: periplasmic heavy metal sensor [Candidatus Omnitrophica bacterium]|nr:periplasmic heavy metal sensor [Candidatus Omnitrophota bacterium]